MISPAAITHAGWEGTDFIGSNCGCLPPDTNAAVGPNHVVEAVNVEIRVFDKTGALLLDEPLSAFFGAPSGGDPYVVYDDLAGRWYVTGFDSSDTGLFIAVSNDSNPLDGFNVYDLTDVGGFPDYNKVGYNKDAIFITYNDFGPNGDAGIRVVTINKAQILAGNPLHYVTQPAFQFRAQPPAQMHGDVTGGVEWFMSTDGTDAGGNTIRIMKMTNYFSNSPTFTYTSLPVPIYQSATTADQPGGAVTVFPNTTFTQTQYHRGYLVGAMASATPADGFTYPKGQWFQVYVKTATPILLQHGVIDPGPGVAVQMITVDQDSVNDLGFTWMESSANEFLSMWVGTRYPVMAVGAINAVAAAPGGGFFPVNFRIGDYSSTVLDPSNGLLFWSANEYIGSDGFSDIWRTHVQSFSAR